MIVPGSASPLLLSSAAGYNLTKSLRFRSSANAYLNRTPSSAATSRRIMTYSAWVKLGILGTQRLLYEGYTSVSDFEGLVFNTSNQLEWTAQVNGGTSYGVRTPAVFRDPSAWYHIVCAIDTTQATDTNRVKIYVNGVQQTGLTTFYSGFPAQNTDLEWNNQSSTQVIGWGGHFGYYDGYMAEINMVDGQALTPSSFGETSTTTGVWIPKKFSGTYGTNGFYLPFTDTTSTSTLGTDFSGNSNTWTVNNISLTSGSTYDSMNDVPTLTSATTANYATFNGIGVYTNLTSNLTYSNGNLQIAYNNNLVQIGSSIRIPNISGKFYLEFTATYSSSSNGFVGLFIPNGTVILQQNGVIGNFGVCTITSTTGVGYSSGQIISFAIDADTKTATIRVNNTVNTVIDFSALPTGVFIDPAVWLRQSGDSFIANYGQQPFTYTPPTGFVGLNTFNLPTPTIGATASTTANKYFDVTLYTGNGTSQSIVNSGAMQPDLVWEKRRDAAQTFSNGIIDSVRGRAYSLVTNLTIADQTSSSTNDLTSFNSNGFSIGPSSNLSINDNGGTYVAWQWRANSGTNVTNTQGSITSTVSANTTAGFSIVAYTGNGTNGATVGHGLGAKPFLIIEKGRTSTFAWSVQGCGELWTPATSQLFLNNTNSLNANGAVAAPTSTVYTPSVVAYANESGITNIAYCFAPVAGFSAMGSYTGNDSADGTFIYTGFRPAFILYKKITGTDGWVIFDTKRNTYNVVDTALQPNTSGAEASSAAGSLDILSNGFKQRNANNIANSSSFTYLYMAFAESPFKYANAR